MGLLPTIPQTITIGDVTIYLMGNDISAGALWGARLTNPNSPVLVAYVTDALRWQYEGNPTDSTLFGVARYLIWLCGTYGSQAIAISGGGSVIPIPPGGTLPNPIEFVVSVNSLIPTGSSSVTIPSFIGFNVVFTRNNISQTMINTGGTYYSWNKITGLFSVVGDAIVDELFSITPVF